MVTEQLLGRLHHVGIRVDGIKKTNVFVLVDEAPDGTEDVPQRLTKGFPPMRSQQNETGPFLLQDRPQERRLRLSLHGRDTHQRIHDRVSSDVHLRRLDRLGQEIVASCGSGGKKQIGQDIRKPPEHLFGKRSPLVPRTESSLDVPHSCLLEESHEG